VADPVDRLTSLLDSSGSDPTSSARRTNAGYGSRVFGGQVAAQALRAALHTVDGERHPHSMHAYFLRPGSPGQPIRYEVDRIHDRRWFTTRRVIA
jgi:acyl-CoA thioesterase-2